MTPQDIDDLFDLLEGINQRLVRTESKLSALMNSMNLSPKGDFIDATNSGYRQNARPRTESPTTSRPYQRRVTS